MKSYKVYIIHSPSDSENYIDRTLTTELELAKGGHIIMNPLPDQHRCIDNKSLHMIHGHNLQASDVVYAMEGWGETEIGNAEMAEAMIRRKIITFEQQV